MIKNYVIISRYDGDYARSFDSDLRVTDEVISRIVAFLDARYYDEEHSAEELCVLCRSAVPSCETLIICEDGDILMLNIGGINNG